MQDVLLSSLLKIIEDDEFPSLSKASDNGCPFQCLTCALDPHLGDRKTFAHSQEMKGSAGNALRLRDFAYHTVALSSEFPRRPLTFYKTALESTRTLEFEQDLGSHYCPSQLNAVDNKALAAYSRLCNSLRSTWWLSLAGQTCA